MRRHWSVVWMVAQMVAQANRHLASGTVELAVRLHDASAGLAVGIALLKDRTESPWSEQQPDSHLAIEVFEQVLSELRQLSRTVSDRPAVTPRAANARESLTRDAKTA